MTNPLPDYPGAKDGEGIWQTIISQMPPHRTYIECCVGSGAIFRHKRASTHSILVDADPHVIFAWRDLLALNDVHAERDVARSAHVEHGEAAAFLRSYDWQGDELVYADPPYVRSTRTYPRPLYRCELTDAQHIELLEVLKSLPCPVLLSGYWSELYAARLEGWRTLTMTGMTHRGEKRTEWLWMNFPEPFELHDYRWVGKGWRDRQRIKRKKSRWVTKLRTMPPIDRAAILDAIREVSGSSLHS
jgi:DNA adenine methylase